MNGLQIAALAVIAAFYIAYFTKMLLQRRKGIQTHQIGKGKKPKQVMRIERFMGIATVLIVPVEVVSIAGKFRLFDGIVCWIGLTVAALGVAVFIIAMYTMRDSWRAGIPEKDQTALVTDGIYRYSRNPAFLGFDLLYVGILLAFFNVVHLLAVCYAVGMLHLQILQEERYLTGVFGEAYREYKSRVGRYFWIL